ncbi:hypothetical protein [Nonomuraea bangladeshensis]|uniref:hypothetical protein n=1 Tax=Nonomuraea bangladeshensis TaxID=404385 RepID=UPI003C2E04F4
MARRTLVSAFAIVGTCTLWAATVATAVTGVGSDRLHLTLLTGSLVAVIVTLAIAGAQHLDTKIRVASGDVQDTVRQSADEWHEAVDALRQDRALIAAARTLTAELVAAKAATKHDQHAA